jgi:myo-inositol-1(or 4)-monophosphatase
MQKMLSTAIEAAQAAGKILKHNFGKIETRHILQKSKNDYLTWVDKASESKIIEIIRSVFPAHAILAEESGADKTKSDFEWIIDPLDGTKNYISAIPQFAVSIALRRKKQLLLGVVLDPMKNDLFYALHNGGAFYKHKKLRVSSHADLADCLLATGFPFKKKALLSRYLACFEELFLQTSGARRMGAAAIDLAYVAAGRFDGFWEIGLSPWDMAAGAVLISEAGGRISDFWDQPSFIENGYIIASNGLIHERMVATVKKHFPTQKG